MIVFFLIKDELIITWDTFYMLISNGIIMRKSFTLLNNKLFLALVFIDIVKLRPELIDFGCGV